MKRWYLLSFVLLLLLPVTIVQANAPITEEVELTEEQLLEEAERNGWLEPSRVPESSESLKEQRLIHQLSEQFLKNIQQRKNDFEISGVALDFSITSKDQVNRIIFQAVLAAYNKDEYLAYDARGYTLRYTYTSSKISATFQHKYGMTKEQADEVERETKRLAPIITKNAKNDHDKVKAIHDYVVLNIEYDPKMRQEFNTPYHALTRKETLCSGYSTFTYKLLEATGIPARLISGTSNGVGHAWNMVQLDGKWYHLDTTWDDPINKPADYITYNYYMLDDQTLKETHFWTTGGLNNYDRPYPKANNNYKRHLEEIHFYDFLAKISQNHVTLSTPESAIDYFQRQIDYYEDEAVVFLPKEIDRDVLRKIATILATDNRDVKILMYFQDPTKRHPKHQRFRLTFDYQGKKPLVKKLQFVQPKTDVFHVNDTFSFNVQAVLSNGKVLDVTNHSDFILLDPNDVATYSNGVVKLVKRGTFDLFARFRNQEVIMPVQSELEWMIDKEKFDAYEEKKQNVSTDHTWTIVFNDELHRHIQDKPYLYVVVSKATGEDAHAHFVTDYNALKIHPPVNGYERKTTYNVFIHDIRNQTNDIISPPVRFTFTTK